jgi:2'-5' RNA ligase
MRLFIAVNFSPAIRELIAESIDGFPIDRPPWRWTKPDTWHITLKFLGERPESDTGAIARCMDDVAAKHRSFRLGLGAFGGFPNLRRPRVLFYRAEEGAAELASLAADVERSLREEMGIPQDTKPFRAHTTVARVKSRIPNPVAERLATIPPLSGAVQTVESFDLMKSELRREGARYQCLKAFALPPTP